MIKYCFSTFQQLRSIMSVPSFENKQRLLLSLQQRIAQSRLNWRFVYRVQQLDDEFKLNVDYSPLIRRLKESQTPLEDNKIIAQLMNKYYLIDEQYFDGIYAQFMQNLDELQYGTLIEMIHIAIGQNKEDAIPKLVSQLLTFDDIDMYELSEAVNLLNITEENEWIKNLQEDIEDKLIYLMPSLSFKQFSNVIKVLRMRQQNVTERMKNAIKDYFNKNGNNLSYLSDLLHLCSSKQFDDQSLKLEILKMIQIQKIKKLNYSCIKNYRVNNLSEKEGEIWANLITLSGYQVDQNYVDVYYVDTPSKRREEYDQLSNNRIIIENIVNEICQYLDDNRSFSTFMKVLSIIIQLDIKEYSLLQKMNQQLNQLEIQNLEQLLEIIHYYEYANVNLDINYKTIIEKIQNNPDSYAKIEILQKYYTLNEPKKISELNDIFNKNLYLELMTRQIYLLEAFGEQSNPLHNQYIKTLQAYLIKCKNDYDLIPFVKSIESTNFENQIPLELQSHFLKGKLFKDKSKRGHTKNRLPLASHLEIQIYNDLLNHLPKHLKLETHIEKLGSEIDFLIKNQNKELYVQLHGKLHFYQHSKEYNYATKLENWKLSRLSNFKAISAFQLNRWYNRERSAVSELVECIL